MKLLDSPRKLYRYEFEQHLKDKNVTSVKGVLDVMFGERGEEWGNPYAVSKRDFDRPRTTVVQRLNVMWLWPILLVIAPFRYVMLGNYAFNKNSRSGRVISWLIGDY